MFMSLPFTYYIFSPRHHILTFCLPSCTAVVWLAVMCFRSPLCGDGQGTLPSLLPPWFPLGNALKAASPEYPVGATAVSVMLVLGSGHTVLLPASWLLQNRNSVLQGMHAACSHSGFVVITEKAQSENSVSNKVLV